MTKFTYNLLGILYPLICFGLISCKQKDAKIKKINYQYTQPQYDLIEVINFKDTLSFLATDTGKHEIRSFNVFSDENIEYISFYDASSKNISIYNLSTKCLFKKFPFPHFLEGVTAHHTSVYFKNFDSILVFNGKNLYLFDSSGILNKSIPINAGNTIDIPFFDNSHQPIIYDNKIYTSIKPRILETSLEAFDTINILYEFNLSVNSAKLNYHYPEIYHHQFYGYRYLRNFFCFNHKNKFVFSFPADSCIYETDLSNSSNAYYGKSRYQKSEIKSITLETLKKDQGFKNFVVNDAYGVIYFDQYRNRYLREVKHKISEFAYVSRNRIRNQSLIIFDKQFKIMGESYVDSNINLENLFFTKDGVIYAQLRKGDKNTFQFVRLGYSEQSQEQLAEK